MRLQSILASTIMSFLLTVSLQGQTYSWFDINPSQSNTDAASPNGASGGRISNMGAASDLSVIYGAAEWGGLYRSINQGVSWIRVNNFAPSATKDVKVDPSNSRKVYVASFYDGRLTPRSGISISSNGGASWQTAPLTTLNCANGFRATQPSAWQIAIHPSMPDTLFVATNCGLARSFDAGLNWDYVDPSPGNAAEQIYTVVAHGEMTVDVVGDNGHFRSTDNGNTWSPADAPFITSPANSSLAVSPIENNVLFRSFTFGGAQNIFESDDGGTTWPATLVPPANNAQGRIPFVETARRITSNQFDLWFGDVSMFKTTLTAPTSAATGNVVVPWANMQSGAHNDVADILFDPRATTDACPTLFANDGGIYRNTRRSAPSCLNPAWEQPGVTPHATWIWGFDGRRISPGIHALSYGLQDDGGFATTNAREGFTNPVPGWNNYTCCDVSDNTSGPGHILSLEGFFSPGRAFRLFRRSDNGGSASEINNYPSVGNIPGFNSGKGNVRFGTNAYAVQATDGVYTTNNITAGNINWASLNAPAAANSNIGGLKIAQVTNNNNIYYNTGTGNPDGQAGQVFRYNGTSLGGTWTQLPLPTNVLNVNVYDVDPSNGNRLIISGIDVANNFGMWQTDSYGAPGSWTRLGDLDTLMQGGIDPLTGTFRYRNFSNVGFNGNINNFNGYWQPFMVQYNPRDPTTIVAGAADAGIFLSLDDGANWDLMTGPVNPTSALPHIPRPLFAYFSPGRFRASTTSFDVWVGTRGAGVMKVVVEN